MNSLGKSLIEELLKAQESGQLEQVQIIIGELEEKFHRYKIFFPFEGFESRKNLEQTSLATYSYLLKGHLYYANSSEALKVLFLFSKKMNKLIDDQFDQWRELKETYSLSETQGFDAQLINDFISINFSLQMSLKYKLGLSGKKFYNSLLHLVVFMNSDDEIGRLISKVCLRISEESIVKSIYNLCPHIRKDRFKDRYFRLLSEKKEDVKHKQDITILKEFRET